MLRLYFKTDGTNLRTSINQENYDIVAYVLEYKFTKKEREIIRDIIVPDKSIPQNIINLGNIYGIDEETGWDLLNKVTETIAEKRGLI